MEMAIWGCQWADFVVFTMPRASSNGSKDGLFIERIAFDEKFWHQKLLPACTRVFRKFIVLELLTRRVFRGVMLLGSK